jgi:hypothetical protein
MKITIDTNKILEKIGLVWSIIFATSIIGSVLVGFIIPFLVTNLELFLPNASWIKSIPEILRPINFAFKIDGFIVILLFTNLINLWDFKDLDNIGNRGSQFFFGGCLIVQIVLIHEPEVLPEGINEWIFFYSPTISIILSTYFNRSKSIRDTVEKLEINQTSQEFDRKQNSLYLDSLIKKISEDLNKLKSAQNIESDAKSSSAKGK